MNMKSKIRRHLIRGAITVIGAVVAVTFSLTYIPFAFDWMLDTMKENFDENHPSSVETAAGVPAQLIRVVDGDTIAVVPTEQLPATNDSGTEHVVRVLSVDAPEMNKMSEDPAECGAEAATEHLAALLGEGAQLSLVFDAVSDHTDRYGRSLAYVEIPGQAQIVDVGAAMVRDGFAEAWYPNSEPAPERFNSYSQLQLEAASARAGSHATCDTIGR